MDRVKTLKYAFICIGLIVGYQTSAGMRLEETFPESSFGSQPSAPDIGITSGYASRAVADMEAPEDYDGAELRRTPAFRSLASTEVGSRAPTPVVGPADAEAAEQARRASSTAANVPPAPSFNPVTSEPNATSIEANIARKGIQEIALIAGDLGYFPKTLFVTRDVPVRMYVTGASKNTLCIMMDSFQVRKQVRSQKIEEITFTPTLPGKYRFYCPVNGMEGTLVVREFASSQPAN